MTQNIKEEVLKEIRKNDVFLHRFGDVEKAIDLTLKEVGKVIDEVFRIECGDNHPEAYIQRELKKALGI